VRVAAGFPVEFGKIFLEPEAIGQLLPNVIRLRFRQSPPGLKLHGEPCRELAEGTFDQRSILQLENPVETLLFPVDVEWKKRAPAVAIHSLPKTEGRIVGYFENRFDHQLCSEVAALVSMNRHFFVDVERALRSREVLFPHFPF
jgi:hypothetical protein